MGGLLERQHGTVLTLARAECGRTGEREESETS